MPWTDRIFEFDKMWKPFFDFEQISNVSQSSTIYSHFLLHQANIIIFEVLNVIIEYFLDFCDALTTKKKISSYTRFDQVP